VAGRTQIEIPGFRVADLQRLVEDVGFVCGRVRHDVSPQLSGQFSVEPGFAEIPVVFGSGAGNVHGVSRFIDGEAAEEAEFYELSFFRVILLEFQQGFVKGKQIVLGR